MIKTVHSIFILKQVVLIFVLLFEFEVFTPSHNTTIDIVHYLCSVSKASWTDWDREIFRDTIVRRTDAIFRPNLAKVNFWQLLQQVIIGSSGCFSTRNNRLQLEHDIWGWVGQIILCFEIIEQSKELLLREHTTCIQFKQLQHLKVAFLPWVQQLWQTVEEKLRFKLSEGFQLFRNVSRQMLRQILSLRDNLLLELVVRRLSGLWIKFWISLVTLCLGLQILIRVTALWLFGLFVRRLVAWHFKLFI